MKAKFAVEVQLLSDIARALAESLHLEETLASILKSLDTHLKWQRGTITLLDPETETIHIKVAHGLSERSKSLGSYKVGEGITGRVAETGEPLLIGDAANCEFARMLPGTDAIDESQIVVPLSYGTRVVGVIVISKLGLDQFDEDDLRLLEVLAGHAAVALENASLYESARREAERATALLEFSRQLSVAEGIDEVVDRIVELSARALDADRVSVWFREAVGDAMRVRAAHGYSQLELERLWETRFDREQADVFLSGEEPFVFADHHFDAVAGTVDDGAARPFAVAPLTLDGGRRGCVAVSLRDGEFTDRQLRLLAGIADQAKLALTNAGNFQNLERTFLETVEALANALEANDEYTSSHARWITDLALKVGRSLGLDGRALKRLELGALFHDIGKIGIPESILSKPGPLTVADRKPLTIRGQSQGTLP
jgi:GAF domain-containing protein